MTESFGGKQRTTPESQHRSGPLRAYHHGNDPEPFCQNPAYKFARARRKEQGKGITKFGGRNPLEQEEKGRKVRRTAHGQIEVESSRGRKNSSDPLSPTRSPAMRVRQRRVGSLFPWPQKIANGDSSEEGHQRGRMPPAPQIDGDGHQEGECRSYRRHQKNCRRSHRRTPPGSFKHPGENGRTQGTLARPSLSQE